MFTQYAIVPYAAQARQFAFPGFQSPAVFSQQYGQALLQFVEPLLRELDAQMDKRPVRTLVQAVEAILAFRDRNHGLLLSELGDAMDGLEGGGGPNGWGPSSTTRDGKPSRLRPLCCGEPTSK
jgi:hypothetical protein